MNNYSSRLLKIKDNCVEYNEVKFKPTPVAMVAPEVKHNSEDTEITKTCAVLNCDDSKKLGGDEFFRFPEDPKLRQIWTDLTGRSNWMPTDFSYICIQHFSVDCFSCDSNNDMVLIEKAVPSLKLPNHVLEEEYIEESHDEEDQGLDMTDTDNESENDRVNGHSYTRMNKDVKPVNPEVLKLFTQVQLLQRQAVGLKDKLKFNTKVYNRQAKFLTRLKQLIETKKNVLAQRRKRKSRVLLTLQDKFKSDKNLVMAMPVKYTDDVRNFALSIYKYSPQAYVYCRNTLRTMLPGTELLDSWIEAGYTPKSVLGSNNSVKVVAEQDESELSCKVILS